MKINPKDFRVSGGEKLRLDKRPTRSKPFYNSEKDYKDQLAEGVRQVSEQQRLLYACNSYSLLLIFQAMDAAGKDGAISHVLTGVNPQGCEVHSFKHPSTEELQHDFLWRSTIRLPARGRIGVFNRSYYEEVLIVRVHPDILRGEGIPGQMDAKEMDWDQRFRSIVDFERHLARNGTRVLKFFLHLSKEEQRKRFLARIDSPEKNWKFSLDDIAERKFWDHYMRAYEDCMSATSTKAAPWHIVPADDKYNARLIVSRIVLETLKDLDMSYPKLTPARRRELEAIRKQLSQ
jgi:PPK2 family polyphosphate:nucleotide phosphotransferase